jgi:hypothetical protein
MDIRIADTGGPHMVAIPSNWLILSGFSERTGPPDHPPGNLFFPYLSIWTSGSVPQGKIIR